MKIVVCIKQVPETNDVRFDPETNNLIRGSVAGRINPFDKNAIEAALTLREQVGGSVAVLSMGPDITISALREGLAMGADEAYLLSDRAFAGADTLATGYVLSVALSKLEPDLTLLGRQAVDADTGQVGPIVATLMNQAQATYADRIEVTDEHTLTVRRDLDTSTQTVRLALPAVVTVRSELNTPRYETPLEIQKSFAKPLTVWHASDLPLDAERLGQKGSPTIVRKIFAPEPSVRQAHALPSDAGAAVDELTTLLRQKGLL